MRSSDQLSLSRLNTTSKRRFKAALGDVFEHAPWVAERAAEGRPFSSVGVLHDAMVAVVRSAEPALQDALIAAHPDLAGKAARAGSLTEASTHEQAGAGLSSLTDEEYERFERLNAAYRERFGFPFIIAVGGLDKHVILSAFERRLANSPSRERSAALDEIARIARLRLDAMIDGDS